MIVADDYYATLSVSSDADGAAIRAAYRALMRRYHPDVNTSLEAASKAQAINEAYACLRDASKRADYDGMRRVRATYRRTMAARTAAPTMRTVWSDRNTAELDSELRFQPAWLKATVLGAAAVITVITFAITSATPPAPPHPAVQVDASVHVVMRGHREG